MVDLTAIITARGGSKGIPNKNLVLLAGKPLICWTIEAALGSPSVGRVLVSTDNEAIAEAACNGGAEVPFLRPAELARDDSPHIDVVCHALDWLKQQKGSLPDYVLLLQPTSPLRSSADIEQAFAIGCARNADAVVSVTEAEQHPYLTKQITDAGTLVNFIATDIPYLRRQALPKVYALNGALYLTRPAVLLEQRTFMPARTFPYVMPRERSLDIDHPWDLYLANLILEDGKCHSQRFQSADARSVLDIPASLSRKPA
jgi:CMP-N-acetylneuraminic acid synthetase